MMRRPFAVRCVGCGEALMTLAQLADDDIVRLREHLRRCPGSAPLDDAAPLGEVMRRLSIVEAESC